MSKFSRTVDYYGTTYKVNKSGNIDCGKTILQENEYEITATAPHHRVHRIIAKAFPEICGVWFEGCHVHHINGNKTDNRVENLVILTPKAHKNIHGNLKFGTNTEFEDKFCKRLLKYHIKEIQQWFGLSNSQYLSMFWLLLFAAYLPLTFENASLKKIIKVYSENTKIEYQYATTIMEILLNYCERHNLFHSFDGKLFLVPILFENYKRISSELKKEIYNYFYEEFNKIKNKAYEQHSKEQANLDNLFNEMNNEPSEELIRRVYKNEQ